MNGKRVISLVGLLLVVVLLSATVAAAQAGGATITIVKDATPNSTQNFNFSAGALGGFILDDAAPSDNDLYPSSRSFELLDGVYNFSELVPSNWRLTGIDCTADAGSSVNVTLPNVAITLGGGDVTCIYENELTVNIYALKYRDVNGNGVRNGGEPVLAGWTITATLQPGGPTLSAVTNASQGRANFQFVQAGTWKVCEVLQGGWTNTQPGGAEPCYTVTLAPGQVGNVWFGNRQ